LPPRPALLQIAQQGNLCGHRVGAGGEVSTYPHADPRRRPRILFLGGGMGAGKSSLLKEVMRGDFWNRGTSEEEEKEKGGKEKKGGPSGPPLSGVVVIEADRIKLSDPIFLALTKIAGEGGGGGQAGFVAEEVHSFSTSAANQQLLAALLHGRDVSPQLPYRK
jgi:hypothetical protein